MDKETLDFLQPRISALEGWRTTTEDRLRAVEDQTGRLTSHVESEVGLARKDIKRIEDRLFGANEDSEFGGRIGQMSARMKAIEIDTASTVKAAKIFAWVLGTVVTLYAAVQIILAVAK